MTDQNSKDMQTAPAVKSSLITVHGTGAGDTTAAGDKWWQIGSDFISGLTERLDLNPQQVRVVPFQWEEGPNSEAQRRHAAEKLLKLLLDLEAKGNDYYLIGHSHGGSVIYNTLLLAVRGKHSLKHMKQWCTVGTPFLDYRANTFMFQRLGSMGLTIYSSGIASALLAGSFFAAKHVFGHTFGRESFVQNTSIALLIYSAVCLVALFLIERRGKGWYSAAQKKQVSTDYADTWLGLWHQEDEAISALNNVRNVSGPIIPRSFLQPLIAIAQLLLVLGVGFYLSYDTLAGGDIFETWTFDLVAEEGKILPDEDDATFLFGFLGTMFVFLFLAIWLGSWLLKKLMWYLGAPLAWVLNRVIWTSVRQRAWGDDLAQEDVRFVSAYPPDFEKPYKPLPELIAEPLRAHSDNHAISTLNKVRQILGMAADSTAPGELKSELAASLEWKELIHTSYFDVPEFIDLLATGLHNAGLANMKDGFAAPEADRQTMRDWLSG